jgi:hypothetical protein
MTNPHPNATTATGTAGVGVLAVWLLGNVFHIDISAETGAAIAGGVTAVVLFVGRHGVKGVWRALMHGDNDAG